MICVKSCLFGNTYSLSILSWGLKLCRMRDLRDSAPVHFTVGMQYMYDIRWAPRSMYKYKYSICALERRPQYALDLRQANWKWEQRRRREQTGSELLIC